MMSGSGHGGFRFLRLRDTVMRTSDDTDSSQQFGVSESSLRWRLETFDGLAGERLYAVLAARVAVFVVEQDCAYQELDGLDDRALHLVASQCDGAVAAYARILPPGTRFEQPSVGRVLTALSHRGTGLGRALMRRAIVATRERWPGAPIRISAQCHLQRFYAGFGFRTDSAPYDEDGIEHVDMQLDRVEPEQT
jgi:ElaA protein